MKIVKVEVGKEPYVKEIDGSLESIENEVEGVFDIARLTKNIIIYFNDCGMINGMKLNCTIIPSFSIYGPFFLVGYDEYRRTIPLTDKQAKDTIELINSFRN